MEVWMRYPVDVRWSDEDKAWLAEVYDLPGCIADGETQAEAVKNATEAARAWIEVAREDGRSVPEPTVEEDASGEFMVRTSKALHQRLKRMARQQNVSLNQLAGLLLAEREADHRKR